MPEDKDGSDSNKASEEDDLFFLRVATSSIDIRNVHSLLRPLLPPARARHRTCSSLSSVRSSITALHLRLGRLHYRKRVTTAVRPASAVGRSVDDRPLSSSFSLSRSATWHHISLVVQNGLYVDYNYTNGVEKDGLT